ncbi:hypothetical protein [Paraburkholderia sp. DHOC27]|uniref:hypothetical protein n=1 Tax=Paraburkholderia sp. DHOC27 TaxID=2303330 RepID=UPI000E3C988F|nr:hypothetical protein [Paraburkholderia sp. DHOC27]RFU48310.1 hypothetical protein D0B32_00205 [Paraburkholderia sp. DHOC27]
MIPICVLDTAIWSSVGLTSAAAAAAVRCGLSGFAEYEHARDRLGEPVVVATPPAQAGNDTPAKAMADMAVAAVLSMDGLEEVDDRSQGLAVFLSLPEARPGLLGAYPETVAAEIRARVNGARVARPESFGHASGGAALLQAAVYLQTNSSGYAIVVGVDTYINRDTLAWLDTNRQLHATYNAWGFIPGAAAGACLVCHPNHVPRTRRPALAIVEQVAFGTEAVPIKSAGVCLGRAITGIVDALAGSGVVNPVFDSLYCDLNGEAYRSDELGFMLSRCSSRFREPGAFHAPADCWGDVGAASIPLFIALAIHAAESGYSAGPTSLHLAGSEAGLRSGVRLRTRTWGT